MNQIEWYRILRIDAKPLCSLPPKNKTCLSQGVQHYFSITGKASLFTSQQSKLPDLSFRNSPLKTTHYAKYKS